MYNDYNLKIIFLDTIDYLNNEARKMGFINCKDMIYKCVSRGYYKMDYTIKTAIYMCDIRNNIAHGDAQIVSSVTKESLWIVYVVGIVALGYFSNIVGIKTVDNNDIYFYKNGELVVRLLKLKQNYENDGHLILITDFFS